MAALSPKRRGAGGGESIEQLKEENFCLRLQVTKLQVALRKSVRKDGSRSSPARSAPAAVSQEQMDTVMNELVALRKQVGQLHEENRRLQAQLQNLQGAHLAVGHGDEEPWIGARQDAFSRGDIQYIEREILCLKQKLSDTRQKLKVTDDPHPASHSHYQQPGHEAAQTGAAEGPAREPLGPASLNRDHDSFSFFPQPAAATVTGAQRSKAMTKAGAGNSSKPSALRARAGAAAGGAKKAPISGIKPLKENREHSGKCGLPAARSKVQRKG